MNYILRILDAAIARENCRAARNIVSVNKAMLRGSGLLGATGMLCRTNDALTGLLRVRQWAGTIIGPQTFSDELDAEIGPEHAARWAELTTPNFPNETTGD